MPQTIAPKGRPTVVPSAQVIREKSSRLPEALLEPVGHQWPVLVRDVVADVVAIRVHHERRVRRLARNPLRLRGRKQAVAGTMDHEQRLRDLVENALEV